MAAYWYLVLSFVVLGLACSQFLALSLVQRGARLRQVLAHPDSRTVMHGTQLHLSTAEWLGPLQSRSRRLSCDSGVVEIVEGPHGVPVSVGRKRRTVAGALKRALLARDGMCTYPGCTNHLFLEGHHIKHWADGGETSLSNTSLLCTHHHRYVHEYGHTIELGPDQRPRFRDPQGRPVVAAPERIRTPDLGWPRIRAMNEHLAIDASTIACEWDGSSPDYGTIIGHLLRADGLS